MLKFTALMFFFSGNTALLSCLWWCSLSDLQSCYLLTREQGKGSPKNLVRPLDDEFVVWFFFRFVMKCELSPLCFVLWFPGKHSKWGHLLGLTSSQRLTSLCPLPFYLQTFPSLVNRSVKIPESTKLQFLEMSYHTDHYLRTDNYLWTIHTTQPHAC